MNDPKDILKSQCESYGAKVTFEETEVLVVLPPTESIFVGHIRGMVDMWCLLNPTTTVCLRPGTKDKP